MILKDWDVWLNYACYFVEDIREQYGKLANSLVDSDLCKVVYDSNGYVCWKKQGRIRNEKLEINRMGYEPKARIEFPLGLKDYPLEGAYQSAKMRWYEISLLNIAKFEYIRGFLGACYFEHHNKTVVLYPQIKIYNNGVFILSYRIISPKEPYPLRDLIENEINLYKYSSESINVPPEWMELDTRAMIWQSQKGILNRLYAAQFIKSTDGLIEGNTRIVDEKDFKFAVCPLDLNKETAKAQMHLQLLNDMVGESLTLIVNGRTTALKYIVRGCVKKKVSQGIYWCGLPSIYLLKFENQPNSSKSAVKKFKNDINRIMLRTTYGRLKNSKTFPWKDHRIFDDYSFFMNKGVSLFVFGKNGLKSDGEYADPNRGHIIYDKQILIEALMFNYISHLRQLERSTILKIPTKKIIKEQQEIYELEKLIKEISNFGEIEDVFEMSSKTFDLTSLRVKVEKNLVLKAQSIREQLNLSLRRFSLLISILFGLFGALSFTSNILKPVWLYFNLWMPNNLQLKELFSNSISLIFFLIIITVLWKSIFAKMK